ncbi:MAG TPA: HAD hydrolase-like protein [Candidatus Saccharimonadales bacterium]
MITKTASREQFAAIDTFLKQHDIKLLISDFNGVLDDYYVQKYAYLAELLGEGHEMHLADFAVFTDTQYMADRTATLEQSLELFLEREILERPATTDDILQRGMHPARITSAAREFLERLSIPYVIYTSQGEAVITDSLGGYQADVYHRERTGREKPSTANLKMIAKDYGVPHEKVCVLGDGLIDDLMPARLLGMKTVLVSPFADVSFTIR